MPSLLDEPIEGDTKKPPQDDPNNDRKPLVLPSNGGSNIPSSSRSVNYSSHRSGGSGGYQKELVRMMEKMTVKLTEKEREFAILEQQWKTTKNKLLEAQVWHEKAIELEGENSTLKKQVQDLQVKLKAREKELVTLQMDALDNPWNGSGTNKIMNSQDDGIDSSRDNYIKEIENQRDAALKRAGELAQQLAESRAAADELQEQYLHVCKQQGNGGSSIGTDNPGKFWSRGNHKNNNNNNHLNDNAITEPATTTTNERPARTIWNATQSLLHRSKPSRTQSSDSVIRSMSHANKSTNHNNQINIQELTINDDE